MASPLVGGALQRPKTGANRKGGCGEIGRHTRLRIWRSNPWGFESLHPHGKKPSLPA